MIWEAEILVKMPARLCITEGNAMKNYSTVCGDHSMQAPGCCKRDALLDPHYCSWSLSTVANGVISVSCGPK